MCGAGPGSSTTESPQPRIHLTTPIEYLHEPSGRRICLFNAGIVDQETCLLLHDSGEELGTDACANRHIYEDTYTSTTERISSLRRLRDSKVSTPDTCYGQECLLLTGGQCLAVQLRRCKNTSCFQLKRLLDHVAPDCQWSAIREWTLIFASCHASYASSCPDPGSLYDSPYLTVGRDYSVSINAFAAYPAVPTSVSSQTATSQQPTRSDKVLFSSSAQACIDVAGIMSLRLWIRYIFRAFTAEQALSTQILALEKLPTVPEALLRIQCEANEASDKLYSETRICTNRLWGVAVTEPLWQLAALELTNAAITEAFRMSKLRIKDDHGSCSENFCRYSDDNSTNIAQMHKCVTGNCSQLVHFPPQTLDEAFREPGRWYPTAWRLGTQDLLTDQDYMAVSHVWLDGTGAGTAGFGVVTGCLYEFWAEWARQLNCDGIWWDAICVPAGREQRARAINSMHENYENAKCILVHDTELVDFEWRDDGSPLIALLLSAWFTRGWTAVELFAGRRSKIKVLYKSPSSEGLIAKDLDDDILGYVRPQTWFRQQPNGFASTWPQVGHFIAAEAIQRCRYGGTTILQDPTSRVSGLKDIKRILGPRYTSWARDRMIIAGIFCLPTQLLNARASGPEITKSILQAFHTVTTDEIVHFEVPMEKHSAWSWCPESLFDLGQMERTSTKYSAYTLQVGQDGSLTGFFEAHEVSDFRSIVLPSRSCHPAVRARISNALAEPNKCVLLTGPTGNDVSSDHLYLLAIPFLPLNSTSRALECHAVAWVTVQNADAVVLEEGDMYGGVFRGPQWPCRLSSRLGDDGQKRTPSTFEEVCEAVSQSNQPGI